MQQLFIQNSRKCYAKICDLFGEQVLSKTEERFRPIDIHIRMRDCFSSLCARVFSPALAILKSRRPRG